MKTQFTSLTEPLLASIHSADIRSLVGMYAFMLFAVLLQGKTLVAEPTLELLLS